ncbi:MAG: AMP-binding protein [Acidimicrobiales bacterium]
MGRLVVLDAVGGPGFVAALRRAWDDGDAVLPLDPRLPRPTAAALLATMRPDEPVEDGDALVVATSGTTGVPRGVVLTHDALAASAVATSARLGVDPGTDRWLACLPLAHVGGLSVVVRALLTGTPLTVVPGPDPAVVNAAAAGHTLVSLVPTVLARIDPTRWRRIVLGGSAPPAERPPNTVATYGMTETGSGIVYDGVPLDGVEVAVDAAGELRVRAPMLLRAYRDGTTPLDTDGWFATGDLGAVDPDSGLVTVHGRRGDLIITGGENVWPEPVERLLAGHPAVTEAAVVGRPDPEWGQRVVAVVVAADPAHPPALAELREHVRATLPAWCAPRSVELVAALPRTALGKVRRHKL